MIINRVQKSKPSRDRKRPRLVLDTDPPMMIRIMAPHQHSIITFRETSHAQRIPCGTNELFNSLVIYRLDNLTHDLLKPRVRPQLLGHLPPTRLQPFLPSIFWRRKYIRTWYIRHICQLTPFEKLLAPRSDNIAKKIATDEIKRRIESIVKLLRRSQSNHPILQIKPCPQL